MRQKFMGQKLKLWLAIGCGALGLGIIATTSIIAWRLSPPSSFKSYSVITRKDLDVEQSTLPFTGWETEKMQFNYSHITTQRKTWYWSGTYVENGSIYFFWETTFSSDVPTIDIDGLSSFNSHLDGTGLELSLDNNPARPVRVNAAAIRDYFYYTWGR